MGVKAGFLGHHIFPRRGAGKPFESGGKAHFAGPSLAWSEAASNAILPRKERAMFEVEPKGSNRRIILLFVVCFLTTIAGWFMLVG